LEFIAVIDNTVEAQTERVSFGDGGWKKKWGTIA